jgi:hypothetical protein
MFGLNREVVEDLALIAHYHSVHLKILKAAPLVPSQVLLACGRPGNLRAVELVHYLEVEAVDLEI